MSDPRVPDGELHPERILDPEGVDPDLLSDDQRDERAEEREEDELIDEEDVDNPTVEP